MATVLTQTNDLLKRSGWVFHREGELISPDSRWVIKVGYSNFEGYAQLQTPGHPPTLVSHLRLYGDHDGLTDVLDWLATKGVRLDP